MGNSSILHRNEKVVGKVSRRHFITLILIVLLLNGCGSLATLEKPVSNFRDLSERALDLAHEFLSELNDFRIEAHFIRRELKPKERLALKKLYKKNIPMEDIRVRLNLIAMLRKYSEFLVAVTEGQSNEALNEAAGALGKQIGRNHALLKKSPDPNAKHYVGLMVKILAAAVKLSTAARRKKSLRTALQTMDPLIGEIVKDLKRHMTDVIDSRINHNRSFLARASLQYSKLQKSIGKKGRLYGRKESIRLDLLAKTKLYLQRRNEVLRLKPRAMKLMDSYRDAHGLLLKMITEDRRDAASTQLAEQRASKR